MRNLKQLLKRLDTFVKEIFELYAKISKLKGNVKNLIKNEKNAKLAYEKTLEENLVLFDEIESKKLIILNIWSNLEEILSIIECEILPSHQDISFFDVQLLKSDCKHIFEYFNEFSKELSKSTDDKTDHKFSKTNELLSFIVAYSESIINSLEYLENKLELITQSSQSINTKNTISPARSDSSQETDQKNDVLCWFIDVFQCYKQQLITSLNEIKIITGKAHTSKDESYIASTNYKKTMKDQDFVTKELNKFQKELESSLKSIFFVPNFCKNLGSLFSHRNRKFTFILFAIFLVVSFISYKVFRGDLKITEELHSSSRISLPTI